MEDSVSIPSGGPRFNHVVAQVLLNVSLPEADEGAHAQVAELAELYQPVQGRKGDGHELGDFARLIDVLAEGDALFPVDRLRVTGCVRCGLVRVHTKRVMNSRT